MQLVNFGSDEHQVQVAKTSKQACELAGTGFEYLTEVEGV
jgi:hypothetical protein